MRLASLGTQSMSHTMVAKLQQTVNLANENCDRATVLAQKLSTQLRQALSRINELEIEADGLANRMRAEVQAGVAKFQSDANARVERAKIEADERIARVEAELESRVRRLQGELARAQQFADRAKADAQAAQERIARSETEAHERLHRTWTEMEDRLIRLKSDLAQAELRAGRAEQWLLLIRQQIEDHLMPSFATMHDSPIFAGTELSKQTPASLESASRPSASGVFQRDAPPTCSAGAIACGFLSSPSAAARAGTVIVSARLAHSGLRELVKVLP